MLVERFGDNMDERLNKLSNTIVNYSVGVKENDRVLIQYESSMCKPLIKCLIKDSSLKIFSEGNCNVSDFLGVQP